MTTGALSAMPAVGSANADWIRGLQRTASITSDSERTLAVAVAEIARTAGALPALSGTHNCLTYGDLSALINRYARWGLERGLAKGDRVALMLGNRPEYAAIWIGLGQIGVVTALLNVQLVGKGLSHALSVADAKHLIVGSEHAAMLDGIAFDGTIWVLDGAHGAHESLAAALETIPDTPLDAAELGRKVSLRDAALLIYTSGTTGLPKAAHVSHYRVMMWSEWFAGIVDATPEDRLYNCLPMYHSIGGVVAVGAMLVAGGTVIVREGFSATRLWPDVSESGATIFQYIGELCRYLLAAGADSFQAHSLRLCIGNGLRAEVWERFADRFAIPRIIEFYAATEGSFSLFNLEGRPGAIGRIPRFIAHRSPVALVAFDDASEQPARGDDGFCRRCQPGEAGEAIGMIRRESSSLSNRFEGYTNARETERKVLRDVFEPGDMWFRTGDLMRQDTAGFFYFVDRIGETFRWKGENIATTEVADAIAACEHVADVAVYGVAVPHTDGRAGMAALVTRTGFDLDRFRTQLAMRLPRAARPVFLRLASEMALTGTFKLKKHDLMRDGFDPTRMEDALFVDDSSADTYVPIDREQLARIQAGEVRL